MLHGYLQPIYGWIGQTKAVIEDKALKFIVAPKYSIPRTKKQNPLGGKENISCTRLAGVKNFPKSFQKYVSVFQNTGNTEN